MALKERLICFIGNHHYRLVAEYGLTLKDIISIYECLYCGKKLSDDNRQIK